MEQAQILRQKFRFGRLADVREVTAKDEQLGLGRELGKELPEGQRRSSFRPQYAHLHSPHDLRDGLILNSTAKPCKAASPGGKRFGKRSARWLWAGVRKI